MTVFPVSFILTLVLATSFGEYINGYAISQLTSFEPHFQEFHSYTDPSETGHLPPSNAMNLLFLTRLLRTYPLGNESASSGSNRETFSYLQVTP